MRQIRGHVRLLAGLVVLHGGIFCSGCARNHDVVQTVIPAVESRFSPISEGTTLGTTGLLM